MWRAARVTSLHLLLHIASSYLVKKEVIAGKIILLQTQIRHKCFLKLHFVWLNFKKWHVIWRTAWFPPPQLFLKTNDQNMAARHESWQERVWFVQYRRSLGCLQVSGLRPKSVCMTEALLHVAQCSSRVHPSEIYASNSKPKPTLCPPPFTFFPSIRPERVSFTPAGVSVTWQRCMT